MTTFIICVAVYLLIGVGLIIWAVCVDARTLWALPIFPLIIIAWPYFLIRGWME